MEDQKMQGQVTTDLTFCLQLVGDMVSYGFLLTISYQDEIDLMEFRLTCAFSINVCAEHCRPCFKWSILC